MRHREQETQYSNLDILHTIYLISGGRLERAVMLLASKTLVEEYKYIIAIAKEHYSTHPTALLKDLIRYFNQPELTTKRKPVIDEPHSASQLVTVNEEIRKWWQTVFTGEESSRKISNTISSPIGQILENIRPYDVLTESQETSAAHIYHQAKEAIITWQEKNQTLSQTEIDELYKVIAAGYQARALLINANMRLVFSIAKKYYRSTVQLEDLVQEGMKGLIIAVDKFDPRKDLRFSTYGTYWIKQHVSRYILSDTTIRIPVYLQELVEQHTKQENSISQLYKLSPYQIENIEYAKKIVDMVTLEHPEDDAKLISKVAQDETNRIQEKSGELEPQWLQDMFEEVLSAREEIVLKLAFGFGKEQPHSPSEIAHKLNLSVSYVDKVKRQALDKVRGYFDSHEITSSTQALLSFINNGY